VAKLTASSTLMMTLMKSASTYPKQRARDIASATSNPPTCVLDPALVKTWGACPCASLERTQPHPRKSCWLLTMQSAHAAQPIHMTASARQGQQRDTKRSDDFIVEHKLHIRTMARCSVWIEEEIGRGNCDNGEAASIALLFVLQGSVRHEG